MKFSITLAIAAGTLALIPTLCPAQSLLWSIPNQTGKYVLYRGDYTQVIKRPDAAEGDLTLSWRRELTIKALETEEAEVSGKTQPCRWIEFKVITGPDKEGIIDAGPGGIRLYKVLIPLQAIASLTIEEDGVVTRGDKIEASYIPIAKGYRRIGNEAATPIEDGVFHPYPALSMIQHYRKLETVGEEQINIVDQSVTATHLRGKLVTEDPFTRSTNQSEIWRTDSSVIPFGVAKWESTVSVERKDSTDPRSQFTPLSVITEIMSAEEVGDGAISELVIE